MPNTWGTACVIRRVLTNSMGYIANWDASPATPPAISRWCVCMSGGTKGGRGGEGGCYAQSRLTATAQLAWRHMPERRTSCSVLKTFTARLPTIRTEHAPPPPPLPCLCGVRGGNVAHTFGVVADPCLCALVCVELDRGLGRCAGCAVLGIRKQYVRHTTYTSEIISAL
jgi:hypothetical protein